MGQRHDPEPDSHEEKAGSVPDNRTALETRPGELELRVWLETHPGLDATGWVTALSQETAQLMKDGRTRAALRLLELTMSPASPVFDTLTGPRAKELALRLETSWAVVRRSAARARGADGARPPHVEAELADLDARFAGLISVLRSWLRYRRNRRHERESGSGETARGHLDAVQVEKFYQGWVLEPLRQNFLRVLEDRGLTRRNFCSRLGISEAYLSQILNGRRNPSLRKLAEISYALQVDLGRIFAVNTHGVGDEPWSAGSRPEPGDTVSWYPGKVSRPYAALEAHYRLLFYPGPDLPGEKILARSFLIVDPTPTELGFDERYALHDASDTVVVASYAGAGSGGKRQKFMAPDGRTLETVASPAGDAKGTARLAGRVTGTLVEF